MKVLVVIANHGTKNTKYVERLLKEYRTMTQYNVDVVVLSDADKDLGADVDIIVGTPIQDPWSLPFGYKKIFKERVDKYDLFIYSEDDTLITEASINAFIEASEVLPDNYIAGFLRYEIAPDGTKYYSTMHGHYHWDPNSVVKFGEHTFAYYTNEHSACFIITKEQLKRGIESGGVMAPARKGRYDMLVTAATDPYTQCGMKKLICISRMDDFCLHHLPNKYCGEIGFDAVQADEEIAKLISLPDTEMVRGPLCETSTSFDNSIWEKKYYETANEDLFAIIPKNVSQVLSVGCGCGSTEQKLVERGAEVTAIPLDCITKVTAEAKGIRVVEPDFKLALEKLNTERFDCILFNDILNRVNDSVDLLREFSKLLNANGSIVISAPNFQHISVARKLMSRKLSFKGKKGLDFFDEFNLHFTTFNVVKKWLKECELLEIECRYALDAKWKWFRIIGLGLFDKRLSKRIILSAKRSSYLS